MCVHVCCFDKKEKKNTPLTRFRDYNVTMYSYYWSRSRAVDRSTVVEAVSLPPLYIPTYGLHYTRELSSSLFLLVSEGHGDVMF